MDVNFSTVQQAIKTISHQKLANTHQETQVILFFYDCLKNIAKDVKGLDNNFNAAAKIYLERNTGESLRKVFGKSSLDNPIFKSLTNSEKEIIFDFFEPYFKRMLYGMESLTDPARLESAINNICYEMKTGVSQFLKESPQTRSINEKIGKAVKQLFASARQGNAGAKIITANAANTAAQAAEKKVEGFLGRMWVGIKKAGKAVKKFVTKVFK